MTDTNRETQLKALSEKVRELESNLKLETAHQPNEAKWNWTEKANKVLAQIWKLAEKNKTLVRGELDGLLEWPSKEMADPKLFLGGKPGFEIFNRDEHWFETMGFDPHQTPYTFSNRWDKALIKATFLVPKDLDKGLDVRFMWYLHGGGFCTGAGDFIPWYSKTSIDFAKRNNAIIIAPDYPLGPEANYKDIVDSIREFLRWYGDNGCFESGFTTWRDWLIRVAKLDGFNLVTNHVLIEGESAGGHAAVTAAFLNAENVKGTKIGIDAMLLRFPMLKHYARDFPADGNIKYMGSDFTRKNVEDRAKDVRAAIDRLEAVGLVPTRTRDHPPHRMSAAFLLSVTKTWKSSFQRLHHPDHEASIGVDDPDYMDCLERPSHYVDKVDTEYLPPIIMYHGHDDGNCPIQDTMTFKNLLIQHYGDLYYEDGNLIFIPVNQLRAKPEFDKDTNQLVPISTKNVGHGFDYNLDVNSELFLAAAYEDVDHFWVKEPQE